MRFGERIKQLRKSSNYTQEELADLLGVKKVSVQKYENGGIANLKTETLEKLGEIFNVSPAYIMGWDTFDENNNSNVKEDVEFVELIQSKYGFLGIELNNVLIQLNDIGKRKVLFYAEDLVENKKYCK